MVNQVNCVNIGNVVLASLYRIGRDIEAPGFTRGETHREDKMKSNGIIRNALFSKYRIIDGLSESPDEYDIIYTLYGKGF